MKSAIRPTGLFLICLLGATGCGGGGGDPPPVDPPPAPETVEEFFAVYARLLCEKARECDAWLAAYTQEECEAMVVADLASESAFTSGALSVDPDRARACLALLAAGPACAAEGASDDYCFEEEGAFVGTAEAGSACDSDAAWLCAPGTVCSAERFSGACGTCVAVPLVDPGEPCETTANCRQTATTLAYCGFDEVDMRDECVAWNPGYTAALGESCEPLDAACTPGTQCDWSDTQKCVAQIAIGEECEPFGDLECVNDAECVDDAGSSLGGICRNYVVARAVGDECGLVGADLVECSYAAGLACDEGTGLCVVADGGAGLDEACDVTNCAAGFFCAFPAGTCAPLLADGEPCDYRDECLSGFCFGPDGSSVCGDAASVETACAL